MKVDETILRFFTDIQSNLKKDKGIDIGIEEIHNIVNCQLESLNLGVSKGLNVQFPRMGTFLNTDKKGRYNKRLITFEEIEKLKESDPNYNSEKAKQEAIKKFAIETKENINNISRTSMTVDEVENAETVKAPRILFKSLYNAPVKK